MKFFRSKICKSDTKLLTEGTLQDYMTSNFMVGLYDDTVTNKANENYKESMITELSTIFSTDVATYAVNNNIDIQGMLNNLVLNDLDEEFAKEAIQKQIKKQIELKDTK